MTSRPSRAATRRLVINWPLIEQRRIAAGLTQAQLTDRTRGGALTGRGRLWTDADHDHVPLGLLERLCQVLDLHPAELFRPPARAAHRRALASEQPPADATVLEAALATITVPAGTTGTPIGMAALAGALGWSLDRLGTAVAALTEQLTGAGTRIDADPVPAGTPIRGLRARDRYLTSDQRAALHRLRRPRPPLDAKAAEVLDVIARAPRALTECHRDLDPEVVIALQQRGIIRRHPRGDSLELTDDAQFSLAPGEGAYIPVRALTFSWRRPLTSRVVSSDILVSFHTPSRAGAGSAAGKVSGVRASLPGAMKSESDTCIMKDDHGPRFASLTSKTRAGGG